MKLSRRGFFGRFGKYALAVPLLGPLSAMLTKTPIGSGIVGATSIYGAEGETLLTPIANDVPFITRYFDGYSTLINEEAPTLQQLLSKEVAIATENGVLPLWAKTLASNGEPVYAAEKIVVEYDAHHVPAFFQFALGNTYYPFSPSVQQLLVQTPAGQHYLWILATDMLKPVFGI